jgi:hypothetical protein
MRLPRSSSWLLVILLGCPRYDSSTKPGPGPGEGEPCEETADCDSDGGFPLTCVTAPESSSGVCKVTCAGSRRCNDVVGCNYCVEDGEPVPYCDLTGCS